MTEKSEAQTIADLATAGRQPSVLAGPDGRTFIVTPQGCQLSEYSDPHGLKLTKPRYVSQGVTLQRSDSLIAYLLRFKLDSTVLFADINASSVLAVVDYHKPVSLAVRDQQAEHGSHRVNMNLPLSLEWQEWSKIDGEMMGQLQFARFIEEHAPDIAAPSAGELLDVVRDLHANRKVNFIKAVRTASNNEDFEYTMETTVGTKKGSIEIPTQFKLSLPVYFGERMVELFAYLRWEMPEDGGALRLGLKLARAEYVRQAMFQEVTRDVADKAQVPIVFGRPERHQS